MQSPHMLASRCENLYATFEQQYTISLITSVVDTTFPLSQVEGAIDGYREIIRRNVWYFPTIEDVDIPTFITRWESVHREYFSAAKDIFSLLAKGNPRTLFADPILLKRVIGSETMRGWVGKRSPTGPDELVEKRVEELESLLLGYFDSDAIDELLTFGGLYLDDPNLGTAEKEIVRLFAEYHQTIGSDLDVTAIEEIDRASNGAAIKLLRGFCRYSAMDFNNKYHSLLSGSQATLESSLESEKAHEGKSRWVRCTLDEIPDDNMRSKVRQLLADIKLLNFVNLNLEVKYSFKGWTGLMHQLVFGACAKKTDIATDVYAMHSSLKGERK